LFGTPYDTFLRYFESHGIRYSGDPSRRKASFGMMTGQSFLRCGFTISPSGHLVQIIIQYPLLVKEAFRPVAAEYLTRANYGLVPGNFQLDMRDGEVRHVATHLLGEGVLSEEIIHGLFSASLGTTERYLPGLMQVLYAGITPEDAVHLVELDLHAHALPEDPAPAEGSLPSRSKRGKGTTASPSEPASPTALRTLRNHGPRGRVNGGRRSTPPRKRDGDERQGH
jgi:hypothetical protein